MTVPADIVNRAFDQVGRSDLVIGDLEEGTEGAMVALRHYKPALEQLLRAAHWTFARKMAPLTMLADATGNTDGVSDQVIAPWIYEYAYPIDCMKARFLPANYLAPQSAPVGNITISDAPLTTGATQPPYGPGMRLRPAPFLISFDPNFTAQQGSNWQSTIGTSPVGSEVVLTNINQAQLVYTAFMPYPSVWDALFEQSMVDLLTVRMAVPLARDPRMGAAVFDRCVGQLKTALTAARAASANESAFPQTTDNIPDWIRGRRGPNWGTGNDLTGPTWSGVGYLWQGWDSLAIGGNAGVY